jgi:Zn-finger nucleic acid-binding protein
MDCVQCTRPLRGLDYEGATIHSCDGCGGEFLGDDALAHVIEAREARFEPDENDALWRPAFGVPECARRRRVECPRCATVMEVGNYGGDSGVFIDRCPDCGGVWLDHAELERVQRLAELAADRAGDQLRAIAKELDAARRESDARVRDAFQGSRFAFVNALINRLLDVA